jgi:hypothetical protein
MENRLNIPAETLETFKAQILDKMEQGYEVADVPCELLVALVERTLAWMRLEENATPPQKEKASAGH